MNTPPPLAAGYTWHMSLRLDRPVEGTPLRPYAYLYAKKVDDRNPGPAVSYAPDGSVLPPAPAQALNPNDPTSVQLNSSVSSGLRRLAAPPPNVTYRFTYYMSSAVSTSCANGACPRAMSFSALEWSKYALKNANGAPNPFSNPDSSFSNSSSSSNNQSSFSSSSSSSSSSGSQASSSSSSTNSQTSSSSSKQDASSGFGAPEKGGPSPTGPGFGVMCLVGGRGLYKEVFCGTECLKECWRNQPAKIRSQSVSRGAVDGTYSSAYHGASQANPNGSSPYMQTAIRPRGVDEPDFDPLPQDYDNFVISSVEGGPVGGVSQGPLLSKADAALTGFAANAAALALSTGYNSGVAPQQWIELLTTSEPVFYPPPHCVGRRICLVAEALDASLLVAGVDASSFPSLSSSVSSSSSSSSSSYSSASTSSSSSSSASPPILMSRSCKTDVVLAAPSQPPKRRLLTLKGGADRSGGPRFRVVSYNILAEIYATQQQYPYCDFWALGFDYRWANLKREMQMVEGDVICLQEVQSDHYQSHVMPFFQSIGYDSLYKQKTRDSMGPAGKVDGCALLWRANKFRLETQWSIEFNDLAARELQRMGLSPRSEEGASYLNRLKKDNVAQVAVLEALGPAPKSAKGGGAQLGGGQLVGTGVKVCVVNTHLYSNKDFPSVKLWQAWQLVQQVEDFALSRNLPLVLCGDLNSTPTSSVYDFLAGAGVHPQHPDLSDGASSSSSGSRDRILPDCRSLVHGLNLASAYAQVVGQEPAYTNYTENFKGVLDYIWVGGGGGGLRTLSTSPVLEENLIKKHGDALPNTQFGSDHILLLADLQFGGGD